MTSWVILLLTPRVNLGNPPLTACVAALPALRQPVEDAHGEAAKRTVCTVVLGLFSSACPSRVAIAGAEHSAVRPNRARDRGQPKSGPTLEA